MPIAAVPAYLGNDFKDASPGMRFGMYLQLWGVNHRSKHMLWTTHDVGYEVSGQNQQEREVKYENKVSALTAAKRLGDSDKKAMRALNERQTQVFDSASASDAAIRLEGIAISPFTTGLGNEHPLENGFAFLNPYGLPYFPGSGVKGVLRQAARELAVGDWGETHGWSEDKEYSLVVGFNSISLSVIDVLFGLEAENGETEHLRGVLSFWDVIPQIRGDSLLVEIMTPHQGHYYQWKKDSRGIEIPVSPHESGQPNPISFLTVPPGSGFAFHVQCDLARLNRLAPNLAADGKWKVLLTAAFEHAFDWLGFGAKTAVGYGAMRRDEEAEANAVKEKIRREADAQRNAAMAAMSPNIQQIEKLREEIESRLGNGHKLPVSDQFWGGRIKKLALVAAENAEWSDDEKSALADMLEEWAGKIIAIDAKELRKQLKLNALRGRS